VNNLWTRFRCENRNYSYDVFSSLKELKRSVTPAKRFKDNPRWLGKGWARLVRSTPLDGVFRNVRWRQNSPVPLAVFAHRQ